MADEMIFLTPQDVTVLRQLKELLDSSPGDWTQPYPEDVPSPYLDASQGAEVYLVRVPEGGIPAAYTQSNATGTNSIYDYLIPGTAECRVLHWVEDPELGAAGDGRFAALDGFSQRVYNVGFEDVEGGIWALAAKVKDGVFIFVGGVSTSSTGTGTDGGSTPVILGCYLKRDILNRITLNLDQLIGEGLEVGTTGGCPAVHIKLNAGCHILITTPTVDDPVTRIKVDVPSLAGDASETGLKPYDGAACTPLSNDYTVHDPYTEQFLRMTDSRLLRIGDNLTQVNLWDLEEFYYNAAHELIDHAVVNTVLRIKVINLCCDASGTGTGTGTGSPSHNYCIAYLQGEAGSELDGGWPYIAPFCIVMTEDDAAFLLGEGFQVVGPFDAPDGCQMVCGASTGTGSPASMWYCLYDPESQEQGCFDLTPDELFAALATGLLYSSGPYATSGECATACGTATGTGSGTGSGGIEVPCCNGVALPSILQLTISSITFTPPALIGTHPLTWNGSAWVSTVNTGGDDWTLTVQCDHGNTRWIVTTGKVEPPPAGDLALVPEGDVTCNPLAFDFDDGFGGFTGSVSI